MSNGDQEHSKLNLEDTWNMRGHSSKIKNAIKTTAAMARSTVVVVPLLTMTASRYM